MTRASAVQSSLLEAALAGGSEWRQRLDDNRRRHGLERVPTFLVPVVLSGEVWDPLVHTIEGLQRALVRLQRAYFDDGRFRKELSLPEGVSSLTLGSSLEGAAVCCRFDVALDPDRPLAMKVLEVQAGDPSGAGWTDLQWDGLEERLSTTTGAVKLRSRSLMAAHRRMTLDALAALSAGAPEDPLVAFVCARDSFVRSDHEAMATLYRRFGTRALVIDPRDVEVGERGLLAGGERVDAIIRDTVDEYVTAPFAQATERLRAHLASGATLVMPPFRDALLDDKRALALLSSGAADELLSEDEGAIAAVRDHLPWTRVLDDASLVHARGNREQLVVKPADGYGGFGVVVGEAVDDAAWQAALEEARGRPSILQERQPLPTLDLPSLDDAANAERQERFVCVSLWCHGGRFSGGYARASEDVVVNVHRGGGIVPLAFAD